MSAWETQILKSVSGIGEAYREPLLEIVRTYGSGRGKSGVSLFLNIM